jgi:hypothetical protein
MRISEKELTKILQRPGYSAQVEPKQKRQPLPPEVSKRNKYGAVKCDFDGYRFDSKAEMKHYGDLRLLEITGHISQLEVKPVFQLA